MTEDPIEPFVVELKILRDAARKALGKPRAQLNGPKTPQPNARKRRRQVAKATRKANR